MDDEGSDAADGEAAPMASGGLAVVGSCSVLNLALVVMLASFCWKSKVKMLPCRLMGMVNSSERSVNTPLPAAALMSMRCPLLRSLDMESKVSRRDSQNTISGTTR